MSGPEFDHHLETENPMPVDLRTLGFDLAAEMATRTETWSVGPSPTNPAGVALIGPPPLRIELRHLPDNADTVRAVASLAETDDTLLTHRDVYKPHTFTTEFSTSEPTDTIANKVRAEILDGEDAHSGYRDAVATAQHNHAVAAAIARDGVDLADAIAQRINTAHTTTRLAPIAFEYRYERARAAFDTGHPIRTSDGPPIPGVQLYITLPYEFADLAADTVNALFESVFDAHHP
ncbi:hypothetical protein ACFXG4_48510 [Nocardia sp. NPDC059246]|uniref:hypothetical protein n=1 Tax=Nocardia sp. NPDC059246 TaxID=3346789 RepID=UPI0036CE3608